MCRVCKQINCRLAHRDNMYQTLRSLLVHLRWEIICAGFSELGVRDGGGARGGAVKRLCSKHYRFLPDIANDTKGIRI